MFREILIDSFSWISCLHKRSIQLLSAGAFKGQSRRLTTAVVLFLLFALTSTQFPLQLGALINSSDHSIHGLSISALILILLACIRSLTLAGGIYFFQLSAELGLAKLRTDAFRSHISDRHGCEEVAGQGGATSLLWNDASHVRSITGELLPVAISESLMLISALSAMLYLDWRLGIIVLAISPLSFFVSRKLAMAINKVSSSYQQEITEHNNRTSEDLSRKSVIFHFGRVAFHAFKYRKSLNMVARKYNNIILLERNFTALNSFLSVFIIIIVFVLGAAILRSDVAAGHTIAFVFLAQAVIQSVSVLVGLNARLVKHLGAAERFLDLVTNPPDHRNERRLVINPPHANLVVEGLSHHYGRETKPSLEALSFEARCGELTLIRGGSGSGKTTLAKLLLGFIEPTNGLVTYGEIDIIATSREVRRNFISYVPQEPSLVSGTIFDNISYGKPKSSISEVVDVSEMVGIKEYIDTLADGYQTIISSEFTRLSGGQQQRLSIARALLTGASILILDEPTSALDHDTSVRIFKLLRVIAEQEQLVILLISHDPAAVPHAHEVVKVGEPITQE